MYGGVGNFVYNLINKFGSMGRAESVCSKGLHGKPLRACDSKGCIRQGDWFLVTAQIIKKFNTTLTRFRPEPGFFTYRVLIY